MFWVLLTSAAVLGLWQLQRRWLSSRQRQLAAQLNTNIRTLPFLGHSYKFIGNEEDQMRSYQNLGRDAVEAGGISKVMLFNRLFINVTDPVVAGLLLGECLEKDDLMKVIEFLIGDTSLIAPVPIWRHRRKVVAPLFSSRNLIQFVEIFSEHSNQLVENLNKEVGRGPFSFWDYIVGCNMNIVCARPIHSSFLDFQLDTSEGSRRKFSDRELMEEAFLLVVAAYDTTATAAGFAALMLAEHQDVQERVYKELLEVFGDSGRAVVHEDLRRLPYLEAVILRLYPVAPLIVRKADKDVQLRYRYAMLSLKTVLAQLVRRYRLVAAPARAPLRTKFNMLQRHVGNYPLQLEAR